MRTIQLLVILAAGAVLAAVAGCSETLVTTPDPNQPPDTAISSSSPEPHGTTSFQVHINWNGSDSDGRVDGYYYAWDDTVNAQGQLTWQFTTASESTFVVTADSCASPPCSGTTEPFFDYHTFWVKAIDDNGAHDSTPAFRTFTATTVAPDVNIIRAPLTTPDLCAPNTSDYVFIEWRGSDPDGRVIGYWYQWNVRQGDYPTRNGPDPEANGWTFLTSDSTSTASRQARVNENCNPANSFAIFAVDDAGAIGQVTRRGAGGNFVCFCPDSSVGGPGLCIDGGVLGRRSSTGAFCDPADGSQGEFDPLGLYQFENVTGVFQGTPVGFRWSRLEGDATTAPLVGYRYAIDNPSGFTPLSRTNTSIADSIYTVGSHIIYVEAVDRAGIVDQGEFRFVVSEGPVYSSPPAVPRILLVDDNGGNDQSYGEWAGFQHGIGGGTVTPERANWDSLLAGFRYDIWDAQARGAPQVPSIEDYTTIIWNTGMPSGDPTLRRQLFQPRAEYLSSYIRAGGNVIICGMNPLYAMLIRGATNDAVDLCEQPQAKGVWLFFDPALCGNPPDAFPHFLFTRLGFRQLQVPVSTDSRYWQLTPDRTVRGLTPIDAAGRFNHYLAVDTLRAGGEADPTGVDFIPAVNITTPAFLESWVDAIYYLDSGDPSLVQNIIAVVADNNLNPRRPATDHAWGKGALLSVNPFFLKMDDARWYFQTLLRDEFLEPYNP